MKFAGSLVASILFVCASARPITRRAVDPSLVPEFGVQPGQNPTGTGDCDGINGIKIPCICPPSRDDFLRSLNANVAVGFTVNNPSVKVKFPTDNSKASKLERLHTATVTLQNLRGPGVGCPQAATTFGAQAEAIQNGADGPAAPAPAPAAPAPPANNTQPSGSVDPALVPEFGVQPNQNPTGTGDCDGINGIKIPCICPPSRESFIQSLNANVAAGFAVNNPSLKLSFPTDNSKASKLARLHAATVTLQNLRGPGVGCPQASTTFSAQADAIEKGTDTPTAPAPPASAPPASAPPAPAPPANNTSSEGGVDPALVPEFGVKSGQNPTGTGDCDGINGIKIPCICPPDRQTFLQSLNANVAAGFAVNNPSVKLSFPTDDSKASKLARMHAATVTLQNMRGPGVGCPQASTTFGAQAAAIQNGQ